jgi:hypothetical protein
MTAVEWFAGEIKGGQLITNQKFKELLEQAKEMEDAQRLKDFKAGNDSACMEHENIEDYFKQYIKSE